MEIEEVVEMSKKVIQEQDKQNCGHSPTFFIEDGEGRWNLIVIPLESEGVEHKNLAVEALSNVVDQSSCKRYFSIFVGWSVKQEKVKKKIEERFEDLKDNHGEKKFYDFCEYAEKVAKAKSPSEHPDRIEVLVVSDIKKGELSNAIIVPITRDGGKLSFGKQENIQGGNTFDRFNVWAQYQIDLNDEVKNNGKENKEKYKEK